MSDKTEAPWGPDRRLRTTLGTIGTIVGLTAVGVAAWVTTRGEVQAHTTRLAAHDKRLEAIEQRARDDHDILVEMRADIKSLVREHYKEQREK